MKARFFSLGAMCVARFREYIGVFIEKHSEAFLAISGCLSKKQRDISREIGRCLVLALKSSEMFLAIYIYIYMRDVTRF